MIYTEEAAGTVLRHYVVEIGSLHDIYLSIRSGKAIPDYVKNRQRNCQTYTADKCMTMLAIPLSIMTNYVARDTDDENYDRIIKHINRYNLLFKELSKIIVRIYKGTILEDHISSIDDGKILLALLNITIQTIMDQPLIIHPYEPEEKVLVDDYDKFPDLPKTNRLELPKSQSKNTNTWNRSELVMKPIKPPASNSYSKIVLQPPVMNITDSHGFPPLSTPSSSKRR
jgi:hypothetical protein